MRDWQASDAEIELNEIDRRLQLIAKLQSMMASKKTDEVHDLLPLFGQGLRIFGPMYESVEYRANRSLATVIRSLLGDTAAELPNKRPDLVATTNSFR